MVGSSRVALTLSLQLIPITRITITQPTIGDVPFHTAIPGQPLTTFYLITGLITVIAGKYTGSLLGLGVGTKSGNRTKW